MTIESGSQVSLEYTLKLDDGTVVDTNVGGDALVYVHGEGQIIPGLERELTGMEAGQETDVKVDPKDGYGDVNQEAIQEVPTEHIPEDARHVGAQLQGRTPEGGVVHARVAEVKDASCVVDFNHPLAGEELHFHVKVLDVAGKPAS